MNPLTLSILVAAFPRQELGTAIGIWAGVSALALAIGPVLGGVLVEHVGWSAVFWINLPVGIVGMLVTLWAVAESRDPTTLSLDLPGIGLITGGLFLLVWGLIETNDHSWTSAYTIGFLLAAVVVLGAFVAWEARAENPMVPLEFFRRAAFSAPVILVVFVGLALFGVVYFITLYFQNVKGWSPQRAGLAALPLTTMVMFIGPWAGKLQERFSPRQLMTTGMLMLTGGLIGLSQIQVDTSYNAIWPFYVLMGAGLALTMPTTSATAMAAVDPRKAGVASGVVNSARQVGAAVGLAVLGAVAATLATRQWEDDLSTLSPALQARGQAAEELVIGGQGRVIGRIAGPAAQDSALQSFVTGVQGAMWVAAALTFAAALTAFIGLRGTPSPRNQGSPTAAPAPRERVPA
jgi:EmrB/QacA subfamily drug resistance transporter